MSPPYDALLLFSFGGPEGPDDVVPFLENVTRGRNISSERLAVVGEQYGLFGGVSPINEQNRALIAALQTELAANNIDLPIYFGNRNWHPLLADTLDEIAEAGHSRVLALVTSAFGSRSGCRQYRDDLSVAVEGATHRDLTIDKIRLYWNHPGFIDASIDRLRTALDRLAPDVRSRARLVFSAHSIPTAWAATSPYLDQLHAAAEHLVSATAPDLHWDLVFQSRSGPPQMPWLEPDIVDHIEALDDGVDTVVVMPIGFVSDHMEVIYDLDTQAAATAAKRSMTFLRVPTVGTHPAFVAGLRMLIEEQLSGAAALSAVAEPWLCPPGCCDVVSGRARASPPMGSRANPASASR